MPNLCTISDMYYDPVTQQPVPNAIIRVFYLDQGTQLTGGGQLAGTVGEILTDATGRWTASVVQGTSTNPSTARVEIGFPDRTKFAGVPPPVAGPLTMQQLLTNYAAAPYSWGAVQDPNAVAVQTVQGAVGINWVPPAPAAPVWNPATQYYPRDGVTYQNGSWLCLTANLNSAPSPINSNWAYIAIGQGSYGVYDASGYGTDLGVAITTVAALLSGGVGTLVISTPMTCAANTVSPTNLTLSFVNAGSVSVASGVTLRILGSVPDAGMRQIFIAAGTNTGSAGTGSISFVEPPYNAALQYSTGDRVTSGNALWEATAPSSFPITLTSAVAAPGTVAMTYSAVGQLQAGQPITIDTGGSKETVTALASPAPTYNSATQTGTFSAVFAFAHSSGKTGTSPSALPKLNTLTADVPIGTAVTVSYTGNNIASNNYVELEYGTGNDETVRALDPTLDGVASLASFVGATNSGTFLATTTKAHAAGTTFTNPKWKIVTGVPLIGSTPLLRPEWWGAKADSDLAILNTDCTAALNALVLALPAHGGPIVKFGPGGYGLSDTFAIHSLASPNQRQNLIFEGSTPPLSQSSFSTTMLIWFGSSGWPSAPKAMVEAFTRETLFKGIQFQVANRHVCDVGVDWDWTSAGTPAARWTRFENCTWGPASGYSPGITGQMRNLFRAGNKNFANCDFLQFANCMFWNPVPSGTSRGTWQQQASYVYTSSTPSASDFVHWGGDAYLAIANSTNVKPDTDVATDPLGITGTYWKKATPADIGGCALFIPSTTGQVKQLVLDNCYFNGVAVNDDRFTTMQWGIWQQAGSFAAHQTRWYSVWQCIRMRNTWDYIRITEADSEVCQQFYRSEGSIISQPQHINGRFALLQVDSSPIPGAEYFSFNVGPAKIEDSICNPGQTAAVNPAFRIGVPNSGELEIHNSSLPGFPFLDMSQSSGSVRLKNVRIKQGTGNTDRTIPDLTIHGALSQYSSATGSGTGGGTLVAPVSIGPFPANVTPKALRPLAPIAGPVNSSVQTGSIQAGAIASGLSLAYTYTYWKGGVEYPSGFNLAVTTSFLDTNGNVTTGQVWVQVPYQIAPAMTKWTLYRSDDGGATFYKRSDVTIGTEVFIDDLPTVSTATAYPSFSTTVEPAIYDYALAGRNPAGQETDPSDRWTVQFKLPAAPIVWTPYPTAGVTAYSTYRTKAYTNDALSTAVSAPTVTAIAAASGLEVDTVGRVWAIAWQDPATGTVSHVCPPSAKVTITSANRHASLTGIPLAPAGYDRLIVRTQANTVAATPAFSTFYVVGILSHATDATTTTFEDSKSDASLKAGTSSQWNTVGFTLIPTLLQLPGVPQVQVADYGNNLYGTYADTTADASMSVSGTRPLAIGTNNCVISALTVDGGMNVQSGDLNLAAGQFRMAGAASAPALSAAGTVAFWFDTVHDVLNVSVNGGPWTDMLAVTQQDISYFGLLSSTGTGGVTILPTGGGGATATATVLGGAVTRVDVTSAGDGYGSPPTVFIQPQGGDTPSVTATATCVMTDWGVSSITVTNGGAGYTTPPLVTIFPSAANGAGSGATYAPASDANFQRGRFSVTASNGVASVTIGAGGTGYVQGAPATFSGGAGSGATGYINVSAGAITSITVTNPGTGYTSAPAVAAPTGTGATLTAVLSATSTAPMARIVLAGHTKVPGYASANFYGTPAGGTSNVDLAFKNATLSPNSDKVLLDVVSNTAPVVGSTYNIGYFALP